VKHFRAHLTAIRQLAVNVTGTLLATLAADRAVKAGFWIRIDSIRIQNFCSIRFQFRIWIRIRIQAKTELSKTIFSQIFLK
jgi:uncharacterized membrane protein